MMSDDREAIARLSRVYRAGAAVRMGSLSYTSQCFPALSVAGIRQFSPVSTCQGEGRGFESRRPLRTLRILTGSTALIGRRTQDTPIRLAYVISLSTPTRGTAVDWSQGTCLLVAMLGR